MNADESINTDELRTQIDRLIAVSDTHLSDAGSVYKMDVTGTTQSGEKFTGHFKGLVGKDTRVFTVSYTHLDVYKRQV